MRVILLSRVLDQHHKLAQSEPQITTALHRALLDAMYEAGL